MTKRPTKKQRERIYQEWIDWLLETEFHSGVFLTKPQAVELIDKREVRINPLLTIAFHEDTYVYGV